MSLSRRAPLLLVALALASGCGRRAQSDEAAAEASSSATVDLGPLIAHTPAPRKGMVWIPDGMLEAGTPKGSTPRLPDEELPGKDVPLHGFYIDEYAYPNEAGAIPKTGVNQEEAAALCEDIGKRLCTELEWERACKGPDNTTYEYGNSYRASECGTGEAARLSPSGLKVGCKSGFGVRDMHGGPWEWTASHWGRGTSGGLASVRGGNSEAGEVTGRCANGMGRSPDTRSPHIGFRCCAGDANLAKVDLKVERKRPLERIRVDESVAKSLLASIPDEASRELPAGISFEVDRMWRWRPVGNEELLLASACAKAGKRSSCGLLVTREQDEGAPLVLGWASSALWAPRLYQERDTKGIWVYGATEVGAFRRRVVYGWGRVGMGEVEKKVKVPEKTM